MIANRIYSPSYISLELALNHYGIIPEAVLQFTSVTTQKTKEFETEFGQFTYKSLKEDLFWGYQIIENGEIGVQIAHLEKAILDTLYLNPQISSTEDFDGLRYNKQQLRENLDDDKLQRYLTIFNNTRLKKSINTLLDFIYTTDA